jgi:hypothetical protein
MRLVLRVFVEAEAGVAFVKKSFVSIYTCGRSVVPSILESATGELRG